MNNKKQWSSLLLGLFLAVNMSLAQTPVKLSYRGYMNKVIHDNLGYAAEQLNVPAVSYTHLTLPTILLV